MLFNMKIDKIVTIFFLLVFGYFTSSLRKEILLKTDISSLNSNLLSLVLKIDFISGFIYPLVFFTFFFILFSFSSFMVIDKKIDGLSNIIFFSMIPNFIFIMLNYYYIFDIESIETEEIISSKTRAIIPFISLQMSSIISNYIVYMFPPMFLLYHLMLKKKLSIINSLLISILPIIIVFLTYILLT